VKKSNMALFITFFVFCFIFTHASPVGWRNEVTVADQLFYTECYITTDNSGRIHVATREEGQGERCSDLRYWRSTDNGTNWNLINANFDKGVPGVLYRSTDIGTIGDTIMIIYDRPKTILFVRSIHGGDSWENEVTVESDQQYPLHPKIAIDGGTLHAIYAQWPSAATKEYEIYRRYSTDRGSNWSTAQRLTQAQRNSWHPAVSVNASAIHIVWADNRSIDTSNYEIYYNKSTDHCSTWVHDSAGFPLTDVSGVSEFPDIVAYSDPTYDAVHVVWQDDRTTEPGPGIYYRRSTNNGSSWPNATLLCADGHHPSIAADSCGLHVVFEKDSNIYYLESADWGDNWQDTVRITDTSYVYYLPDMTADNMGRHVVFLRDSLSTLSVRYRQRDIIIPSPPYIANVEKSTSTNGAVLTWGKITTDILSNSEAMDYYVVYRNPAPDFVPSSSDSIGAVLHPDTTYTDSGVLDSTKNYYYLVMAVDEAKNRSKKSNMGYKFNKFVNENTGSAGDRNWVSLPYISEYDSVEDITDDLSPSGDPISKITRLDATTQNYYSWIYNPHLSGWYGNDPSYPNFPIVLGQAYEMIAIADDTVIFVGANEPDGSVFLNENPDTSDRNWISMPYNAAYDSVKDITDDLAPTGSAISKITRLDETTQNYYSWIYHFILGWYGNDPGGANFPIYPGKGYEFVANDDTSWNPTEWSNEDQGLLIVVPPTQKPDISMYVGTSMQPTRAPAWYVNMQVKKQLKRNIHEHCADSYRPMTVTSKDVVNRTKNNIGVSASKFYSNQGTGEPRGNAEDERRISHIVWTHFDESGFENIVFTTYRLNDPYDVLTEQSVSCVTANYGSSYHLISFDVGNFEKPWKDGEETVLIVEATMKGKPYYDIIDYKLDAGVDIQELREVELEPYSTVVSGKGEVYWNVTNSDMIVGYSLYKNSGRLNEKILTRRNFQTDGDVNVKLVIIGGHETVYGSQGIQSSPKETMPIFYTFNIKPNPFVKQTRIDYALPNQTSIEIVIYDVAGRKAKVLVSEIQQAGYYSTMWQGTDDHGRKVASGVYFIRFETGEFRAQDKILLVK